MFKIPNGPVAGFDIDDTLVCWNEIDGAPTVEIECRGRKSLYSINSHNLDYLIKLSNRGHAIIVWSAGGSDWAEAVVKALKIENYVDAVSPKLTYYIDDVKDPAKIIGKYVFYDVNGKRHGFAPIEDNEENK